jgi:formylmethanofuran dehydrogenase subunit E
MKLIYVFLNGDEFYVGQTNDLQATINRHMNGKWGDWFKAADNPFVTEKDIDSQTKANAFESLIYSKYIKDGYTPREKHIFPHRKVLRKNLDKLPDCKFCYRQGCSITKEEALQIAYNLVECAECGKEHKRSSKNSDGEYICHSCYIKNYRPDVPLVFCAECGKEHKRNAKNPNGEYICQSCYIKNYKPDPPLVFCAECGNEHKRNNKNPDGEYICMSCYGKNYRPDRPIIICAECGKEHKRNNKNPDGEYICSNCYVKKYWKRV